MSFETNAESSDYPELIKRVLNIFKPGQFIFTFFANEVINFWHLTYSVDIKLVVFFFYLKKSVGVDFGKKQYNFHDFVYDTYQETKVKNYNVTYAHYTKKPI